MSTAAKFVAVMSGDLEQVRQLGSPIEIVGDTARGMICAPPGWRLLVGDFSGIESVVTAWNAGQQDKVEQWAKFFRTREPRDDPYVVIGRALGHPETTARAKGKIADLAFGYQGGSGAYKNFAPEEDTASDADIERYKQTWRDRHPQIVQSWYGTDRAAIAAVARPGERIRYGRLTLLCEPIGNAAFLFITLPSGRRLAYPFPKLITNRFDRSAVEFMDNSLTNGGWTPCNHGTGAYGGLWTENIVSAIARDLLAAAMVRLEAAGYPVVLHVHDEIVCELPDGEGSLEEFKYLIERLPDWAEGLPIAAKVRNGPRFAEVEAPVEHVAGATEMPALKSQAKRTAPRPATAPTTTPAPTVLTEAEIAARAAQFRASYDANSPEYAERLERFKARMAESDAALDALRTALAEQKPNAASEPKPKPRKRAARATITPQPEQQPAETGADVPGSEKLDPNALSAELLAAIDEDEAQPADAISPSPAPSKASPPPGFSNEQRRHSSVGESPHGSAEAPRGNTLATYIYEHPDYPPPHFYLLVEKRIDAAGKRNFFQYHWAGGRWHFGVKGTYAERKIPYRLRELKAALAAEPNIEVQISEGEKDADTLIRLGFVATTNPGGAKHWSDDLTAWLRVLRVRRVVLHEDNDRAGIARTAALASALSDFAIVRVVRYPDVPGGKDVDGGEDVTYWVKTLGHSKEDLAARIATADEAGAPNRAGEFVGPFRSAGFAARPAAEHHRAVRYRGSRANGRRSRRPRARGARRLRRRVARSHASCK